MSWVRSVTTVTNRPLGGLLLENPQGRLSYPKEPQGTPEVKPTLRILVFRCLGMG